MAAVATYVIAGLLVAFYASIVTLAVYPFYLVARNVVRALRRRRAARAGAVVASPAPEPWRRVALKGGPALGVVLLVAAILIPLYAGVGSRARVAKAQADLRSLASAATIYSAYMGAPPATLDALTKGADPDRALRLHALRLPGRARRPRLHAHDRGRRPHRNRPVSAGRSR
jgi:hypothetical protein